MADNTAVYGFRWAKGYNGGVDFPQPIECFVASGASFDVNGGAQNVSLGVGDPVTRLSDGSVTLCAGSEGGSGGVAVYGIVVAVQPYYDSVLGAMRPSNILPDNVVYGTNLDRQSKVLVVPALAGAWEIDVDDVVTATTEAGYQAFVGENCDHVLTGVVSVDVRAKPKLDISTHATATSQWRIVSVSKSFDNQDFSGANVKLIVTCNEPQDPSTSATGI
jgi:hypothetical protein